MASSQRGGRRLRQPIVVVLGHVDHGKTTLLDKIRGTAVAKKEPGEMTQHVGASLVPASVIEKIAEPLKKMIPFKLEIPGLLFIDTPGHELFANLRRRGGSVADIAILVIDINEGVMPQTVESIEILRERKVPFVVAANKIDKIPGWKPLPDAPFIESLRQQSPAVIKRLEDSIYMLIGQLASHGVIAERFDRVRDFLKTVPIVPVSAKTGEGIPELLAVLAGITQKYMSQRLQYAEGPAKGVVLEVKEQPGYGTTIDVIIYDGVIRRGDIIVLEGFNGPIVTRVRALLMPRPLTDIRMVKSGLAPVEEVSAAAGVRIAAPNLDDAIAGSPLYVVPSEDVIEEYKKRVAEEVQSIRFRSEVKGVVVKADTLGTLEALVSALQRKGIPIRLADVGPLTKREAIEAAIVAREDKYLGVVLLFNVKPLPEAEEIINREKIKVFQSNIIYRLIEDYEKWVSEEKKREEENLLSKLILPGKIRVIPGCVFRRSDPAIVGVEVLGGVIKPGYPLMRSDGRRVGEIMQIQHMGKPLKEARKGAEVAISIRGNVLIGRHVKEGDVLYTDVPLYHARTMIMQLRHLLSEDEIEVLREILRIKAVSNPDYAALAALLR